MGFLARLFGTDPEGRIARARKLIERQQWGEARRELEDLDHPDAQPLLAEANDHLVSMNLDEALARIQAGEPEGAQEHLELARVFGATSDQLRAVRRAAREAAEAEAKATAAVIEDYDPVVHEPRPVLIDAPAHHHQQRDSGAASSRRASAGGKKAASHKLQQQQRKLSEVEQFLQVRPPPHAFPITFIRSFL